MAGTVDLFSAPRLRELLVEQIDDGHLRFLVDVTSATFVDSAGVAVLIGIWWRVRDCGGHLALVGAPGPVRRLFHADCFTRGFALFDVTDGGRTAVTTTLGA